MLTAFNPDPAGPAGSSYTYYRLDENLEPVECSWGEREAFRATGAAMVATTKIGNFGSVVTTFEGEDDGFDPDGPHLFTTLTTVLHPEHLAFDGDGTWHEAEATHRRRVQEVRALFDRQRRDREPELDLL